jgi:hypothetical protein
MKTAPQDYITEILRNFDLIDHDFKIISCILSFILVVLFFNAALDTYRCCQGMALLRSARAKLESTQTPLLAADSCALSNA